MRFPLFTLLVLCTSVAPALSQASLVLNYSQPQGQGSIEISVQRASANAELFILLNPVPHQPTGSGPLFGLGLAGSASVVQQLLSPIGTAPFHVLANAQGNYLLSLQFAPLALNIAFDSVALQWNPVRGIVASSPVSYVELTL